MRLPAPIEFYFDLSSPYAYFAAIQLEAVAGRHKRDVVWRPFLLGVAFQNTGMAPLTLQPMRGAYAAHDWARLARRHGVSFQLPIGFPLRTQAPARLFYAVDEGDPALAQRFAAHLLRAAFARGEDISDPKIAIKAGVAAGVKASFLHDAFGDERWAAVLRDRTADAMANGVFGSPYFIVDGEPFWGADRIAEIDDWLSQGGW